MRWLPHLTAVVNALVLAAIVWGRLRIWRGDRAGHARAMRVAVGLGLAFIALYVTQTAALGHRRFPGNDWVRTLFLVVLQTHTVLAVAVVPLVGRMLYLASRQRWLPHRRLAKIVIPVWLYVTVTGLFIYAMNNWVRPGADLIGEARLPG